MALMDFREPNQVKWVGMRPGHNGTQVALTGMANNNTVVVYTVPAGQTLYLCTVTLTSNFGAAGSGWAWLETAGAVFVYGFSGVLNTAGSGALGSTAQFWPPMEVPTGYVIKVISGAAGLLIYASIYGWVE